MGAPNWVKIFAAAIAAIGWLQAYLLPMFPTVAYWLFGFEGTAIAFGIVMGWPVPAQPSPAPTS